jgi:hypothetical protein
MTATDLTDIVNKQQERLARDRLCVNDGESESVWPDMGWHTPGPSPVERVCAGRARRNVDY